MQPRYSHEFAHIDDGREIVAVHNLRCYPVDMDQHGAAGETAWLLETIDFPLHFLDDAGTDRVGGKPDLTYIKR